MKVITHDAIGEDFDAGESGLGDHHIMENLLRLRVPSRELAVHKAGDDVVFRSGLSNDSEFSHGGVLVGSGLDCKYYLLSGHKIWIKKIYRNFCRTIAHAKAVFPMR